MEMPVSPLDARTPAAARRPAPRKTRPGKQGLYDPQFEKDACGFGFVADIKGRKSNAIVQQAIQVIKNLNHRGACGAETNTGDGTGILLQTPHAFLKEVAKKTRIKLPAPGEYAAGLIYMPKNATQRRKIEEVFARVVQSEGQIYLGARTVPTNNASLGETAKASEPFIRMVFIQRGEDTADEAAFERKLYVIRKRAYNEIRTTTMGGAEYWYVCSLSYKTLVYKGMLLTNQLDEYFPDLKSPLMETALALVHSRFSTNTFPSWDRAHPYRYIAHNGEINTLRGNINWMKAREALLESALFGDDIDNLKPIVNVNGSDSSMFDNVLELMVLGGRSLPHAMMMMIPEPWSKHESMDLARRAFYQFHSSLMEPWDGPAAISFTDGKVIGSVLDRNGLRPARYYVTKDDLIVMASEAGVLPFPPQDIVRKGRLQPGRMFLVDTEQGRIIEDEEIKRTVVSEWPYADWLKQHLINLKDLPSAPTLPTPGDETLLQRQLAFGYTFEDQRILMAPMAKDGIEAMGAMGNDTPLAALSTKSRLLYDYFKQLFAQVTNPPIDSIREEIVTSSDVWLGSEGNLLEPKPADCRRIELKGPVLTNEEFAKIRKIALPGLKVGTLSMLFRASRGEEGLVKGLESLREEARRLIEEEEVNILILSDRGVNKAMAPIPSLLAISGLHHYLIREGLRMKVSIVLETGDAREVHHFALLVGYGASADQSVPRLRDPRRHDPRRPAAQRRPQARLRELRQGRHQGHRQGDVQDGHQRDPVVPRRPGVRGRRPAPGRDRRVLRRHLQPRRRHRPRGRRRGSADPPSRRLPRARRARARATHRWPVPVAQGRRVPPLQPGEHPPAAEGRAHRQLPDLQELRRTDRRSREEPQHAARAAGVQAQPRRNPDRGSRDGRGDHEALQDRRDELRLHQQGSARDPRDRDEPHRRQEQHGRGRRRPRALPADGERRQQEQRDQAGGLRPLRRDERIPRQRPRAPDQDGAGREARRGRPAARHQGVPVDREDAPHHRRRRPDLAAAAPRHLFDRGPRRADPRPEELEPRGARQRQARGRGRRRHDRGGRRQGARRRGADQRLRRRHRREPA